MKDFNGKLAVVTGGASGVGFAISEALAKEGAKVVRWVTLNDIKMRFLLPPVIVSYIISCDIIIL